MSGVIDWKLSEDSFHLKIFSVNLEVGKHLCIHDYDDEIYARLGRNSK